RPSVLFRCVYKYTISQMQSSEMCKIIHTKGVNMHSHNLRDALTGRNFPIGEADRAFDASCSQNVQSTRTDIDDISDLIDGAVKLSARARSIVEAIIGYLDANIGGASAGLGITTSNGTARASLNAQTSLDGEHEHWLTTNSAGGGQAHNNMQPSIIMNFIIRTGV
ncbi:MAG TPA: hypothetical protein VN150_15485, partial [Ochrobactrum sp.]|nr:hypothetical protein [Ochrobactrum sp.]